MTSDDLLPPLERPPAGAAWSSRTVAARLALVAVGLVAWFWTQSLIGQRGFPSEQIGDQILNWTAGTHALLETRPDYARALLISSSAVIDLLGLFLLASAILGPSIRPFLGLLIVFALRQVCQALCALPAPEGMIWTDPGFPSLLVTYGVTNDLFFSGHTAIAVYGASELARLGRAGMVLGIGVALFEAATVLALRAHYTMDVFTGAVTALYAATLAQRFAPRFDELIARWTRCPV